MHTDSHNTGYRTATRFVWLLELLAAMTYTGLLIYALVVSDTPAVKSACPKLWDYMLARGVAGMALGVICVLGYFLLWHTDDRGLVRCFGWYLYSRSCFSLYLYLHSRFSLYSSY